MKDVKQKARDLYSISSEEITEVFSFNRITTAAYKTHFNVSNKIEANESDLEAYRKKILEHAKSLLYPSVIFKTSLIYGVAAFEVFLNKFLFILFEAEPRALKTSSKTMTYEEILSFKSFKLLKEKMINTVLHELFYKSIAEKITFVNKKFGFNLHFTEEKSTIFDTNINVPKLTEIFSLRNIVLHNNAIVNEVFLKNNKNNKYKLGEQLRFDAETTHEMIFYLFEVMTKLSYQILG